MRATIISSNKLLSDARDRRRGCKLLVKWCGARGTHKITTWRTPPSAANLIGGMQPMHARWVNKRTRGAASYSFPIGPVLRQSRSRIAHNTHTKFTRGRGVRCFLPILFRVIVFLLLPGPRTSVIRLTTAQGSPFTITIILSQRNPLGGKFRTRTEHFGCRLPRHVSGRKWGAWHHSPLSPGPLASFTLSFFN